jgi:hypothetical protein
VTRKLSVSLYVFDRRFLITPKEQEKSIKALKEIHGHINIAVREPLPHEQLPTSSSLGESSCMLCWSWASR